MFCFPVIILCFLAAGRVESQTGTIGFSIEQITHGNRHSITAAPDNYKIDRNGVGHLIYITCFPDSLFYMNDRGGTFGNPILIAAGGKNTLMRAFRLDLDRNGGVHVIYLKEMYEDDMFMQMDSSRLVYTTGDGFRTQETLYRTHRFVKNPLLRLDSAGVAQVFFGTEPKGDTGNLLLHTDNRSGDFTPPLSIDGGFHAFLGGALEIGRDGFPHLFMVIDSSFNSYPFHLAHWTIRPDGATFEDVAWSMSLIQNMAASTDAGGNLHLIYRRDMLMHQFSEAGVFGQPELLAILNGGGGTGEPFSMVCGRIWTHILYGDYSGDEKWNLLYMNDMGGAFGAPALVIRSGAVSGQIQIDPNGFLHGIFRGEDSDDYTNRYQLHHFKSDRAVDEPVPPEMTSVFILRQNFPNPFRDETTISIDLPESGRVKLSVYDVLGREVAVLLDETVDAGLRTVRWDTRRLSAGIYLYRICRGHFSYYRKGICIR